MSVRLAAALALFAFSVSGAFAQDLDGPVNLPPSDFDGQQFVDNAGCAFARAGVSGTTVWVPRVDQGRNQICGLAPTFGATAVATAPAPEAPRSPVLAPQDAPGAPIPTVASTVPAAAPTPAPAPAPVVREPGRLTLAEACEGRTGLQPDLIDARTGRPVDCGGATPAVSPAPAEPARLTLAEACARQAATGTRLINSATGQPIACAPAPIAAVATAAPRTLTLAAACAEQQATGVRLVNANTGEPIVCPQPTVTAQATAPQAEPVYSTTVAATVAARQRIDPLSSATIPGTLALGPTEPDPPRRSAVR